MDDACGKLPQVHGADKYMFFIAIPYPGHYECIPHNAPIHDHPRDLYTYTCTCSIIAVRPETSRRQFTGQAAD